MDPEDRKRVGTAVERVGADRIEYDETTDTYRTRFDVGDRTASEAVIAAVSAASGTSAMELPPLYDAVDPDALSNLVRPTSTGSRRFLGTVTFEYADALVTVDGRGTVEVDPLGGGFGPTG